MLPALILQVFSRMSDRLAHVAKRLRENREIILQQWEQAVRDEIPESRGKNKEAIRNSLPKLIEKMAHTLSKEPPKNTAELETELAIAKEHGEQRATFEEYSMQQVIHEYQLLRKVILRVLEQEETLDSSDRDVVLDAISLGERFSASTFHRLHLESIEQLKARTGERDTAERQRNESRIEVRDLVAQRGMRESFVSGLAHDLRTPITAARTNLELLIRRRNEVGTLEVHAGRALGDLSRLEGMIQDLLDANRIRAGLRLPIKVSGIDLVEEAKETLDSLASLYGDRFELNAERNVEGFWDKKGIRRILENLCINAIKYGGKTTAITVCVRPKSEQKVELSVHNWGPPIPPESQKTLFDQFQRAELTGSPSNHGWGVGLAVVRGMAESHGGSVGIQSTADKGTMFTVTLPIDARPDAEQPAA